MKTVNVNDLIVGKEYFVVCGVWRGKCSYVGKQTNRLTKYRFTFGNAENWHNQFGIFACKSNLKIYEV